MKKDKKLQLGMLALSVAAASQGWAQEAGTTPKARTIDEVIVTAQRREESQQVVPVSIAAFSPESITERSVLSLGDLTKVAPGIRFVHQGGGGNMNVVMRGLTRVPLGSAPNAVITYFADVPLNFQGSNIPTYDLANIQVLKGPQGTLFGRNAIGGAVVVTPQAPTYDFGGYIKGSFGNYRYHDVEGAVNTPIIDNKLALRLAGKSTRRDGFTENMGATNDLDDIYQDSIRASLLWEPTDTLSNTTVLDYFKADEAGTGAILSKVLPGGLVRLPPLAALWNCSAAAGPANCAANPNPNRDIDAALAQQQSWGPYKTTSEFDQQLYRKLTGASNRTEWELGSVTLRNIAGYRGTTLKTDLNTDGVAFAPLPIISASNRVKTEQYSDEIHVFGKAFDDKLDYLGGLFYIKEEPSGGNGGLFQIAAVAAPWVEAYEEKTNKAAFAQVGYELSSLLEGLKINAGVRHNQTDTESCSGTNGINTTAFATRMPQLGESGCASSPTTSKLEADESENTYNIGLDWKINESLFTYITHRKGYREGGINTPGFTSPCTTGDSANCVSGGLPRAAVDLRPYQTYEPETLKDIEIGLKSDFSVADMPVRFNIAVYEGKYENVVTSFNTSAIVGSTDPSSPSSSSVGINTGERTLSGFESEVIVELTDDLTLSNSAAYVRQEIDEAALPPIPGLQAPSLDPASPQWSTTTTVRWVMPFRPLDGELVLNFDWYYQEAYFVGNGELPNYDLANLRVEWSDISHSGVDAAFFMRNVFDEDKAYAGGATSDSLGIYTLSYMEPRMFGLEVKYSFGK